MTVLLDTQVLICSYLGEPLSKRLQDVLADPATERVISTASLFEVAIKTASGKLSASEAEISRATHDLAITIVPLTPEHAYRLFSLPLHHRDPFDRMIIATALVEGWPIASGDRQFKRYKGIRLIW